MSKTVFIAEIRLLNAIILNKDLITEENLEKDLLIHSSAKSIFESIELLNESNVPITKGALFEKFSSIDISADMSIVDTIFEYNSEPLETIADIKEDLLFAQSKIAIQDKMDKVKKLLDKNFTVSEEDLEAAKDLLDESSALLNKENSDNEDPKYLSECFDEYEDDFKKRRNGKIYKFGDANLDKLLTYGPAPGGGGIIYAASGMAKTSYLLHMANQLINREIPTIFFELEMSQTSCFDRLISMRTDIPFKSIANPQENEFESIYSAILQEKEALYNNSSFKFCKKPTLTLSYISKQIKKFQKSSGHNYCIVLIDLLSMFQDFCSIKNGLSLAGQIEMSMNKLNAMAKELGIFYLGSVQANRSVEGERPECVQDLDKFRPSRNAIKNSNAFLERSRFAISLFRKKFYADMFLSEDEEAQLLQDLLEVSIVKQNDGGLGEFKLMFMPEYFKFSIFQEDEEST